MKRREFIKMAAAWGGAAVSGPLIGACAGKPASDEIDGGNLGHLPPANPTLTGAQIQQPEPSPTATVARGVDQSRVAIVRAQDRATGVKRALEMLEIDPLHGKGLLIKPNFNSADPFPGSTHPDTLLVLIEYLREIGAGRLAIGDRSGMGDTRSVIQALGVDRMADELDVAVIVFDELSAADWSLLQPEGSHWKRGFALPRPALDADGIVQTCCLKTHRYGGHFTLSLKNSVGLAAKRIPGDSHDYMRELHASPHQRKMIAEINTGYEPDLILLDGMQAFVDGGPARGALVSPGVIIAGSDRVAVDAVGVAILRMYGTTPEVERGTIFEQEQIARAVELGLGVPGPEAIDLIANEPESAAFAAQIREQLEWVG